MNHEEQKVEAMEQVEAQPVEPTDVDSEVTAEQARIAELEAQLETAIQKAAEERERALRTAADTDTFGVRDIRIAYYMTPDELRNSPTTPDEYYEIVGYDYETRGEE